MRLPSIILSALALLISSAQAAQAQPVCNAETLIDTTYQIRVHPDLPLHQLALQEWVQDNCDRAFKLTIEARPGSQVIQDSALAIPYLNLSTVDINFDGYNDLEMLSNVGASGLNRSYVYWLFDPQTRRFSFAEELEYTNPVVDAQAKEITTGGSMGCAGRCWLLETHRLIGDEFVLVRVQRQYYDEAKQQYMRVAEALVDGVMQVVSEEIVDYQDHE